MSTVIIHHIETMGYLVQAVRDGNDAIFQAVSRTAGEVFELRADAGDDYLAVCEMARLVDVDLMDR